MIKQKNALPQVTPSSMEPQNLLVNYLKLISLDDSERYRDARKRLELSRQVSQAFKKNVSPQKKGQGKVASMVAKSCSEENLTDIQTQVLPSSSSSSSATNGPNDKEKFKLFLEEMATNRRKNELIYGYKVGTDPQEVYAKQWGIEASETAGYYKKNLVSTITRGEQGWSEFGITYDNQFFLNYSTADKKENHHFDFNHQTMGCGTFLKAAGKIKIENDQLFISPYSEYLELGPRYIAIILFVLREKGLIFSDESCCIANEKGEPISGISPGNPIPLLNSVSYYLNETRFPLAKSIAEEKNLSIASRLSKLFLNIDDEVLSTRSQSRISKLNAKTTELKTDILDFLLLIINIVLSKEISQKEKIKIVEEGGFVTQAVVPEKTAYQCYSKIMDNIQNFQNEHQIDFSFIKNELSSWFYYMFALSFQAESKFEDERDKIMDELCEIEKGLLKIKEIPTLLPRRLVTRDVITAPFMKFYKEDPIKTCIALLCDYTKGSILGRFFSGAWNRHHVEPVEQFLKKYKSNQFADNLSIQDIYRELFKVQGTLSEYTGKRGTLFARLQFCEKLANEIQAENRTSSLDTSFLLDISEENPSCEDTMVNYETSTSSTSINPTPHVIMAAATTVGDTLTTTETLPAIDKPESSKIQRKSVVFSPPNKNELSVEGVSENNSPHENSADPSVFSFS